MTRKEIECTITRSRDVLCLGGGEYRKTDGWVDRWADGQIHMDR
jgi:hypothetical protein